MSQQSQRVQSSSPPNASPNPETIKALTEKLLEFAQSLAALNQETPPEPTLSGSDVRAVFRPG